MFKKLLVAKLSILLIAITLTGCGYYDGKAKITIQQLTYSPQGHMLHHNGVFSKDGQWIVFDGRNDDTKIGETSEIGVVNLYTARERIIYQTKNQTKYGPGVGAASFNPVADRVIFIHGLLNANKENPYGFTRRTGVAVDLKCPFQPLLMDARDVTAPYSPGSLRGGTHSHCWSGDGNLVSFTYNDELVEPDLRTIGVLFDAGQPVAVDQQPGNNNGKMYAAVVAGVVAHPKPGSDEISKAFDECWVGKNGYLNTAGNRIPHSIAFQGNTVNLKRETVTEIFVVDIDTSLVLSDKSAAGVERQRPFVPKGIQPRRITRTEKGLSSVRHWLRSDREGKYIYALAVDNKAVAQLVQCGINTGALSFLTRNPFSIDYAFNLNNRGDQVAFIGNNNIYLLDIKTGRQIQLTRNKLTDPKVFGAPCFSPDDKTLAFNQYVPSAKRSYVQIMAIRL